MWEILDDFSWYEYSKSSFLQVALNFKWVRQSQECYLHPFFYPQSYTFHNASQLAKIKKHIPYMSLL